MVRYGMSSVSSKGDHVLLYNWIRIRGAMIHAVYTQYIIKISVYKHMYWNYQYFHYCKTWKDSICQVQMVN